MITYDSLAGSRATSVVSNVRINRAMNGKAFSSGASFLEEFDAPDLLNLLAEGTYITDTERRIVFWSDAAERITGWRAAEVVGHSCNENLLVHVDKDGHPLCGHEHCPLHRTIITGEASVQPLVLFAQHRSGGRVPVEVMVAPVRNHAGLIIGGIEVFRDLTESVQEQLRAKEIQEVAVRSDLTLDDRVSFETRFQPRDIVGGDFFRIDRLNADRYAVLVADARGHGLSAALYTMLLRSLWEEHRAALQQPAQFLEIVNARVHSLVRDRGFFGTAILAAYDAASAEVRLVRAGHPPAIRFRADGTGEAVGRPNPALGLLQHPEYHETVHQLAAGDALLLYTDGATELFDRDDHELGREGLLQLIRRQSGSSAGPIADFRLDRLEEQLLQYTNQIHLPDDLTLVKLRRLR